MKILYIRGGDDYAAWTFEKEIKVNNHLSLWKTVNKTEEKIMFFIEDEDGGKSFIIPSELDNESVLFEVHSKEFGEVDENFIKFIENKMIDYDNSKHNNFYIIAE